MLNADIRAQKNESESQTFRGGIMAEKLIYEEFVKQAILKLRTGDYKGIHTVYSGFNEAFRKYFDGANPIDITNQLAKEKKIVVRPAKGGVMLYLPEEVPQTDKAEQVLKKWD
jgi:hypothetical protein